MFAVQSNIQFLFLRTVSLRVFSFLLLILFLAACASQVAPTGGPKDETPPQVVKAHPENLTTHFNSEKISITFDEFVQLNDPTNQVFSSPPFQTTPAFKLRGKTLTIELKDSLKRNSTYTVNFGNAVKDITEGNVMLNYQYVFSTGAAIDSMRTQGRVTSVLDGKAKANTLVMLYRDQTDSIVAKQRPDYNAHTDSSGNFSINHISAGSYKLFALDDQNFNFLYDQVAELIAFADSPIAVHDTLGEHGLMLFRNEAERQTLLGAFSKQQGKATFAFAKRTGHLQVKPLVDSLHGVPEWNAGKDTCTFWVNNLKSDSIAFILSDEDFHDTVKVKMKTQDTKQKVALRSKLMISGVTEGNTKQVEINAAHPLLLDFSFPVIDQNVERKIFLKDDSAKKEFQVTPEFVADSSTGEKRAAISFKFLKGRSYSLLIPDSAFEDLYGNRNDTVKINLRTFEEEDLGNLAMKITFSDSTSKVKYFYEFKSNNGTVIASEFLSTKSQLISFKLLPPGNYSLRIVEDGNGNHHWDTGNYWKHLQPEKIYPYTSTITVRSNWDSELQLKVDNR